MNHTTLLETQLQDLTQRIASARELEATLNHQRDRSITLFGLAHPRSIAITRRLSQTRRARNTLMAMYRTSASDLVRRRSRARV